MVWYLACVFFVGFLFAGFPGLEMTPSIVTQSEERLHASLLKNYQPDIRPGSKVTVELSLMVTKIANLDTKEQSLTSNMYVRKTWTDSRLKWQPSDHAGVNTIRIKNDYIWKPDIVLYNNVNGGKYDYVYNPLLLIFYTGEVWWVPQLHAKTHCAIDLRKFPFDTQNCTLEFGSWTYNGNQIDLQLHGGKNETKLNNPKLHHEWSVISHRAKLIVNKYIEDTYPYVQVELVLRRSSVYYRYVFVAPAVFITLLTPLMFLLPPESGEKTPLGVGTLVVIALLLNMMENYIPVAHSSVPILGAYYSCIFILVSMSLFVSGLITNIATRGPRRGAPPPILVSILLEFMSKFVCVTYNPALYVEEEGPDGRGSTDPSNQENVISNVEQIVKGPKSSTVLGIRQYQLMAMVLDRLLFVLFIVIFLIVAASMVA